MNKLWVLSLGILLVALSSHAVIAEPIAVNVTTSPSNPNTNNNLTGVYNLTNATNATDISTFNWYRVNDSTIMSTSSTLSSTLTNSADQFIFEVTPKIRCTQGDFNISNGCSIASGASDYLNNDSFNFGNSNDGASARFSAIFNYTKPSGALSNTTIFARTGANTTGGVPTGLLSANYTISSTCWNAYADKVRFGFRIARGSPVTPFYSEFVELFCDNSTGWERFYYAGQGNTPGCDNPNGAAAANGLVKATDNDLNSYICVSPSYSLNAQPSAPYFGNPACGRTGSCGAVSSGTVAGFQMNWQIQGTAVNSSATTITSPPVASNVSVSQTGTASTDFLVGSYAYTDADNHTENGTTYKWYYVSNSTVFNTSRNATIGNIANGVQVLFEVTPRDTYENGTAVNSSAYSVVRKQAPNATNVSVYQIGTNPSAVIYGNYTYTDVDNDTENGTTFKWYYVSNSTVFSTSQNTTVADIVNGTIIKFEVTPRDSFSNGTATNSSNYTVLARVPPTAIVTLYNSTGGVVTNSSSLTVTSNLFFTADTFTQYNLSESGRALYITYFVNGSTVLLNQTVNATALSNSTSNTFQIPDYTPYTYTVTVYDQFNKTTTYPGNLLAGNQQPSFTAVQTYRGGVPNSCQTDTVCEIRITLAEDGCSLARQAENIVLLDPSNNTIINDTSLALTLNSGGSCQYKSDSFTPITVGTYPYTSLFTDYGGLSDSISGSFSITAATTPPPSGGGGGEESGAESAPPLSAGPGAGGAVIETIIIKQDINQSFQVTPAVGKVQLRLAGKYDGEFQVVNDGQYSIFIDMDVDTAKSSPELKGWLDFAGLTAVRGLEIRPGEGLNSNLKYIRYTLDAKNIIPVGQYKVFVNVRMGNQTKVHEIQVDVKDSVWAQFEVFWNGEVTSFGENCIDASTANVETNSTSTEKVCTPSTTIRVKHVIALLLIGTLGAFAALSSRTRRAGRQKNL